MSNTNSNDGELQSPAETGRKRIGNLRFIATFLRPYGWIMAGAALALIIAVAATLTVAPAMRLMVDMGFSPDSSDSIDQYFLIFFAIVVVLAFATAIRFTFVSWLGERVVADMRAAVFNHIITLSPVFFEENRSGEIASRLTADTTLIQSVVGSSASIALRSFFTAIGGTIGLAFTSMKLTALVLFAVPLVLVPIVVLGRRVRNLSRASQDKIADLGATVTESFGATQTIQAFNHEAVDRRTFSEIVELAFTTAFRRIRTRAFLTFFCHRIGHWRYRRSVVGWRR